MKHKRYNAAAVLLLLLFTLLSYSAISTKSGTFDEVQHFGMGRYLLQHQKWDVMGSILHPPLGYYITSLPLLFYKDHAELWQYEEKVRDISFLGAVDVVRGQGLLSAPENSGDKLLILSRVTVLLLSLLLGFYVYRFSAELFGAAGGLLSLVLFAFCPNMLAFSGICTQEIPLTAFSFITVYYLWRYQQDPGTKNAFFAGLFLGFALATKFTAFLLIPYALLLLIIHWVRTKAKPGREVLLIFGLAIIVLFGSYGFNLTPFFQGNEYRLIEMKRGLGAFLNGKYSNDSWWYFYLEVILLKVPVPVLALTAGSLIVCLRRIREHAFLVFMLYLPVLLFFVVFSCSKFAVGLRYLLPMFPFLYVSAGIVATTRRRSVKAITVCLLVWLIVGTLRVSPDYLAYFNEIAGGPDNGYKYLVDSNLDWGQELKNLKKYMDKNGIKKVSLSYFGTDSPQRYGIDYTWLPSHHLYNPHPEQPYDIPRDQPIAISATNLQGVFLENRDEFKWLRDQKPVAKIGYSIFIYDPEEIIRNMNRPR